MALSDTAIRRAKPRQKPYKKPYKLYDERGLYLEVSPAGGRWWRLKYRFGGKAKLLSLGTYPAVSLQDARERRDAARKLLANGVDPSVQRKAEKAAIHETAANTFEALAREWYETRRGGWAPSHAEKVMGRFQNHVFPVLGRRGIRTITGPEVVTLAKAIAEKSPDTARRVLQTMSGVFRYAMRTLRADTDPTYRLTEVLPAKPERHLPAITDPAAVGALLRSIDAYEGAYVVRSALQLAPLVFVRPGELRHAEWAEIDTSTGEWRIPSSKMKARREHRVPLSRQALAVLEEARQYSGRGRYVFPSVRTGSRPISDNTLNAALRRMGSPKDEMTAHGFRSVASTFLHEMGYPSQVIEAQLAHKDPDEVRAAYNRATHWPERVKLMQSWADYLDGLRKGADVVPIRRHST